MTDQTCRLCRAAIPQTTETYSECTRCQLRNSTASSRTIPERSSAFTKSRDYFLASRSLVGTVTSVLDSVDPIGDIVAIRESRATKYVYATLPLYSAGSVLGDVQPYLFTKPSLVWMAQHFGLTAIATQWAGSDVADILAANRSAAWATMLAPFVAGLQDVIDRERASSEAHVIYELNA